MFIPPLCLDGGDHQPEAATFVVGICSAGQGRAFTDQHDDVGILEAHGQLAQAFDRVGVHLGWKSFEFAGAVQFADRILVVVEDHNVHPSIVP